MKVGVEYVIYNLVNEEINKTIERVKRQHEEKYGYNSWCDVYEKASNDFFIKSKFNTKNVWVEWRSVTYCIRKKEIASKGK